MRTFKQLSTAAHLCGPARWKQCHAAAPCRQQSTGGMALGATGQQQPPAPPIAHMPQPVQWTLHTVGYRHACGHDSTAQHASAPDNTTAKQRTLRLLHCSGMEVYGFCVMLQQPLTAPVEAAAPRCPAAAVCQLRSTGLRAACRAAENLLPPAARCWIRAAQRLCHAAGQAAACRTSAGAAVLPCLHLLTTLPVLPLWPAAAGSMLLPSAAAKARHRFR